jgi:UDP-N-acetylmuramoyl-tripeptide--D-alanyl-D-alanine ligase
MDPLTVAQIIGSPSSTSIGKSTQTRISSFAIELGLVRPDGLFFALSQPDYAKNFFNSDLGDSNALIPAAFLAGAQACVTRRDSFLRYQDLLAPFVDRLVLVEDTIQSMQRLASAVFRTSSLRATGVTGSAGKTTTKDMIGHIMRWCGRNPLVTERNHNNGLGVPLTLLKLGACERYDSVVLEMGMSSPGGEIARLCAVAPPHIAVVLNVLPVHLEHLGSLEAISEAKFELVKHMAPDGIAVLNGDDPRVLGFRKRVPAAIIFGEASEADIRAIDVECEQFALSFTLCTPRGAARVRIPASGRHNLTNALAAAAVAHLYGIAPSEVSSALAGFRSPAQRGTLHRLRNGAIVIDDSYNSNPIALLKAVDMAELVAGPRGHVIVIAGEMNELGNYAQELHREAGYRIARPKVRLLATIGPATSHLIHGFTSRSCAPTVQCNGLEEIVSLVASEVRPDDVVLIKGSRANRLERVAKALIFQFGSPVCSHRQ